MSVFPKWVYKRGTGAKLNDNGEYAAEGKLVANAEELKALGGDWCDSPAEAGAASVKSTPAKTEK